METCDYGNIFKTMIHIKCANKHKTICMRVQIIKHLVKNHRKHNVTKYLNYYTKKFTLPLGNKCNKYHFPYSIVKKFGIYEILSPCQPTKAKF